MNSQVSYNLQVLPVEKTLLSAAAPAALYGRGIFTTVAIYQAKPFLWEKHWRRLLDHAAKTGVDLDAFNNESVKDGLLSLISSNKLERGRARLTFFDESASPMWNFSSGRKTGLLITTAGFQQTNTAYDLTVSPFPINSQSPLAGVKSCNYLENLLALDDARKRGFDEALRLNERGEITSTAMANVFWVRGGRVFTPPLETGCLAGTTRAFLLENFQVTEAVVDFQDLIAADEIFLTSSGVGIKAVSSFAEKLFGGATTEDLKGVFDKIVG